MSRNNTGNPIGSKAFPDFEDNVKNLDVLTNSREALSNPDRFGVQRKSWYGMERDHEAAQSSRAIDFDNFLQASGYQDLGEYAPGIEITAHSQYVTFGGQPYLLKPSIPVPYTTSGEWTGDDFKLIGDDALRQDLANPDMGAGLVGWQQNGLAAVGRTARDKLHETVSVKDFGAVGDGVTDDRAAIQAAIDYVLLETVGGTLHFPPAESFYRIGSEHPEYPGHALVFIPSPERNQYTTGSAKISGCGIASRIALDTPNTLTSFLYWPGRLNYMKLSGLWFDATSKATTCWSAATDYSPCLLVEDCDFRGATGTQVELATFVAVMNRVRAHEGAVGFRIQGVGAGPATSLTMTACYALDNTDVGYSFGYLTYCTLNSCACDETDIAYSFGPAYGVTMNACGAERINQFLYAFNARGFQLNSPTALSIGGVSSPVTYGIEFVSGVDVTIAGVRFISQRAGGLTYKLGLTESGYGSENITVLDRSVRRSEATWVSNWEHTNPIRFIGDDVTEKAETIQIANVVDLQEQVNKLLRNKRLDHDIVLQLADGVYALNTNALFIEGLHGGASLTIQGNASDRAAVSIDAEHNRLRVNNCSARVIFKDLRVTTTLSTGGSVRLRVAGSRVILQNVRFERSVANAGSAVQALLGSHVTIDPTTDVNTATNWFTGVWMWDDTSVITMSPRDAAPESGGWLLGMRFNYISPSAGGYTGMICTAGGTPGVWKGFGKIED